MTKLILKSREDGEDGWGQATSPNFYPFNLLVMKTVENWRTQRLKSPWPKMVEFHDLVGVAIAPVSNKLAVGYLTWIILVCIKSPGVPCYMSHPVHLYFCVSNWRHDMTSATGYLRLLGTLSNFRLTIGLYNVFWNMISIIS